MSEDEEIKYKSGIVNIARKHLAGYEERVKEIFKDQLRELQNEQIEQLTTHELLKEIDRLSRTLTLDPEEYKQNKVLIASVMKIIDLNRKLDEKNK